MPKMVDHQARREELLEAVWRVVAREGLDAVTIRGIAVETGWSVGALAHYFEDKDDILGSALSLAYARARMRWERRLQGLTGLAALHALVLENLPLDDERELETKFFLNYYGRAIRGRQAPLPQPHGVLLVDRLTAYVREAQESGVFVTDRRPDDCAELLLGMIDGFSLHALLAPDRLPRERQMALVEDELDRMTVTGPGTTRRTVSKNARRAYA